MTTDNLSHAAGILGRLVPGLDPGGSPDGALLEAFLDRRDAEAFAALVRRHGPMVMGVCRRILGHAHDAEDAFQAVFLVLARRADTVRPRDAVGNWLYGVAYRTALHARAANARRRSREMPSPESPEPTAPSREPCPDLVPLLDEELSRLPARYRAAVVLCELEGRPRHEVARHLGIPEGTLSSRLAAARKILAERLSRRGVVLPAAGVVGLLPPGTASAAIPAHLVNAVTRAAGLGTAEAVAAGAVSAGAATLASGVMKAMFLTKLKIVTAVVAALGLTLAAGVGADRAFADGEKPKVGGDGAKPANPAQKDGAKPANPNAPKDGDKPKPPGAKDGDKPANPNAPKDGDKPANPAGGKGEAVTLTGTVSKEDVKRKKDDGTEFVVATFFLTESGGNKVSLPGPRVNEAGKVLDSFSLAQLVGKKVTLTGRGYTAKAGEGASAPTRVVRVIAITEAKEVK